MSGINIFEDDWRDCLRAHYAHVIREHDTNNEQSLITVLVQTGFAESDIEAMRQEIVVELGWVEPAPPIEAQVEAQVEAQIEPQVVEAEPEQQAAPVDAEEVIETGPLVEGVPTEALPVLNVAPEESLTLLEEEIADTELSAEEEAMLTLPDADPQMASTPEPQIMALELPLDAPPAAVDPVVPDSAPDSAPRAAAPLPERKMEKKKPKKTSQMSLF